MCLKKRYDELVTDYIRVFEDKHGVKLLCWDNGLAQFGNHYFSFDEIRYDIDNGCKKGLIFEWQDRTINNLSTSFKAYNKLN